MVDFIKQQPVIEWNGSMIVRLGVRLIPAVSDDFSLHWTVSGDIVMFWMRYYVISQTIIDNKQLWI